MDSSSDVQLSGQLEHLRRQRQLHQQTVARRLVFRDPYQDYWTNVVVWISLSEALLPICMYSCAVIYEVASTGQLGSSMEHFFAMGIATLSVGFTVFFAVNLMVAGFVSAIVGLVCKSLGIDVTNSVVAACTGGCVGLMVSLPFATAGLPALFLLTLATVLGQIGGAYGADRTFFAVDDPEGEPQSFRYGIKHLLIATFWLAILSAIIKTAGMATTQYLNFMGTWLIVQAAGLASIKLWERC